MHRPPIATIKAVRDAIPNANRLVAAPNLGELQIVRRVLGAFGLDRGTIPIFVACRLCACDAVAV
jgi:hypothetical protein